MILIMGLIAGLGTWMLFGTRSTNAANAGQSQIASDLRLAAQMSKAAKEPWGICFYEHGATPKDAYRWFYTEYADNATRTFVKPPKGAAPNTANSDNVKPPDGAFISNAPWPRSGGLYSEPTILSVRFKPVGAVLYAQYLEDDNTWHNFGRDTYVRITDKTGTVVKDVRIYMLGDIGTQEST